MISLNQRWLFLVALALTIGASLVSLFLTLGNPVPLALIFYVWIVVPICCAAIPIKWPRLAWLAAALLVVYVFFPLSLSIGIFYIPAALAMIVAAGVQSLTRWRAEV